MSKVLVTGGSGFIGGHLAELLMEDRLADVTVVDPASPPKLATVDEGRFLRRSVSDFCAQSRDAFDEIYHLASPVGPGSLPFARGRIAKDIVVETSAVADLALSCDARLVFVSSGEVYGGGVDGLCREAADRRVPAAPSARLEYALSKMAAECMLANRLPSGRLVTVYPFNVAGPRQSGAGGFVLPRLVGQAILGRPMTIFGSGMQRRAFCHVRDIALGIVAAARRGVPGGQYNLGNPSNLVSMADLADIVREVVGKRVEIRLVDPKKVYGPHYLEGAEKWPDVSRASDELGWKPSAKLEEIIRDTFEHMRGLPRREIAALSGEVE